MLQSEDRNSEPDVSKRIDRLVECHGDAWAQTIRQTATPQFREDISKAILSCIEMLDIKRGSEICKELQRVNRAAKAAAKSLWGLHCTLQDLKPQSRKQLDVWDATAGRLDLHLIPALAQRVTVIGNRAFAQSNDKGGRPAKIAFAKLVEGLGLAFKHATGRDGKVRFNQHTKDGDEKGRYEGRFLKLVEAVLPSVEEIGGKSVQSMPRQFPRSPSARGKYVYEITRKGSVKKRK